MVKIRKFGLNWWKFKSINHCLVGLLKNCGVNQRIFEFNPLEISHDKFDRVKIRRVTGSLNQGANTVQQYSNVLIFQIMIHFYIFTSASRFYIRLNETEEKYLYEVTTISTDDHFLFLSLPYKNTRTTLVIHLLYKS